MREEEKLYVDTELAVQGRAGKEKQVGDGLCLPGITAD